MPKVPVLTPQVNLTTPTIPEPRALPVPEAAFGGDVAAAQERLGNTIVRSADVGAKAVIALQERNDEQQVLDNQTAFQKDLQNKLTDPTPDENGVPKGFVARQLKDAKGATLQFDQTAQLLKQKYMAGVTGSDQKLLMQRALDAHLTAAREQVIQHEATQQRTDFSNSVDSNIKTNVAAAATLTDPMALSNAIKIAQATAAGGFSHMGLDDATIKYNLSNIAGEMVKSSVNGVIETDPKKARAIFEANKSNLPGTYQAELGKLIDGKEIYDLQMQTWNEVKNFKLADGQMDVAKIQSYVMDKNIPAERKEQVFSYVHSMAGVADTEFKKQKEATERQFTNELVTQQKQGLPYQSALQLATKYGSDPTDIANKQNTVTELYGGKVDNFDLWINKQPETTQAAWEYAKEVVKQKYPESKTGKLPGDENEVRLHDAALQELKLDCIGKEPEQIRKIVNDKMANVVITPHTFWFDTTAPAWQKDASTRAAMLEGYSALEKSYSPTLVNQARAYLVKNKIQDTPANALAALSALGGKK